MNSVAKEFSDFVLKKGNHNHKVGVVTIYPFLQLRKELPWKAASRMRQK